MKGLSVIEILPQNLANIFFTLFTSNKNLFQYLSVYDAFENNPNSSTAIISHNNAKMNIGF